MPRAPHPALHVAILAAAVSAACGDDGLDFRGQTGVPIPIEISAWVPAVSGSIDGQPGRFLVDSGAPITILDRDAFGGLAPDGAHRADLDALGLTLPDYDLLAVYDLFADPPGSGIPDGVLGGDLLRHFAVTLDYRLATLTLDDPPAPSAADIVIPLDLLGGGPAYLPGDCAPEPFCGSLVLPATRYVVAAHIEDQPPAWVMIDTGASATVISENYLASLGDTTNRPRLDGVNISTANGRVLAAMVRLASLRLGDDPQSTLEATDLPALVVPTSELLDNLSADADRPIVALVGGTFLREFLVTLDAPAGRLVARPQPSREHIPQAEWVRPGFEIAKAGDLYILTDVYLDTDAAAQGLLVGDEIVSLDGQPLAGTPPGELADLLLGYPEGTQLTVELRRAGALHTQTVAVENLLPSYSRGP